jgi:hypothetical protein
MNKNTTQEERQLAKLVEKLPVEEGTKNLWLERIRNGEMSEELGEEIRGKITETGDTEDERAQANRTRYLTELAMLIKRWRLSSQASNFRRR